MKANSCIRRFTSPTAALLRRYQHPLRFGLVGISGIILNSAVLWLLSSGAHLPLLLASALASETSIISNFWLNDRWTFRDAGQLPVLQRFLRFNGAALAGMLVTMAVLWVLRQFGVALLPANLLAIGSATVLNYWLNSRFTWNRGIENAS